MSNLTWHFFILVFLMLGAASSWATCNHSNFQEYIWDEGKTLEMLSRDKRGCYLRNISLSGEFEEADFRRADLRNAKITNANLVRANLEGARLQGIREVNGVNFTGAKMRGIKLKGGNLEGGIFVGVDAVDVGFRDVTLNGAIFRGAGLAKADFRNQNTLDNVNFEYASLKEADFRGADLSRARLMEADLNGARYDEQTIFPQGFSPKKRGMGLYPADTTTGVAQAISLLSFRQLEGGVFTMGSPRSEEGRGHDEDLPHRVSVPAFSIMDKEVTQEQWMLVMKENPSGFKKPGDCKDEHTYLYGSPLCPQHPVEGIYSMDRQVQPFIGRINNVLGCEDECMRLPSEEEWEFAARGGTTTARFFDDFAFHLSLHASQFAWYLNISRERTRLKTGPVGAKKPNPYGLYDIYGNVAEWTSSIYDHEAICDRDYYPCIAFDQKLNRLSPSVNHYVIRGGHWRSPSRELRSAARNGHFQLHAAWWWGEHFLGLRLAKTVASRESR